MRSKGEIAQPTIHSIYLCPEFHTQGPLLCAFHSLQPVPHRGMQFVGTCIVPSCRCGWGCYPDNNTALSHLLHGYPAKKYIQQAALHPFVSNVYIHF